MSDATTSAAPAARSACDLRFELNGRATACTVPVERTLADLLHDDLGLTGTKLGCSRGVCGACVTLIDGVPVASCSTFAFQVQGRAVTSIEGLATDGRLSVIQQAFVDRSAFQCGYCTSGMVLLAKSLLDHHPDPDRATITEWISSNVCRCTGYGLIVEAVEQAARVLREGGAT
jgi:carbon-monoxide dehydrogenase small subunit